MVIRGRRRSTRRGAAFVVIALAVFLAASPAGAFMIYVKTFPQWSASQCSDGVDNNRDGRTDYPNDPNCVDSQDLYELPTPACDDSIDNDGDSWHDYPFDPGCSSPSDTSEGATCDPVAGAVICLIPSTVVIDQPLQIVSAPPADEHTVAAYLDVYRFTLPGGIVTTLPCVTLVADAEANLCQTAGGTLVSRSAIVPPMTVTEPDVGLGSTVARVRICNATLTVTVNGFGVNSAPAFTLC